MKRIYLFCCVAIFGLTLKPNSLTSGCSSTQLGNPQADDALFEEFQREAPRAWRSLEKHYKHFTGKASLKSGGAHHYSVVIKSSAGNHLLEDQAVATQGTRPRRLYRVGINDQYTFLHERINEPESKWLLSSTTPLDDSSMKANPLFRSMMRTTRSMIPNRINVVDVALTEMVESSAFQIREIREIEDEQYPKRRLLRIDFYAEANKDEVVTSDWSFETLSGYVYLLPEHYWVLESAVFTTVEKSGGRTVEYQLVNRFDFDDREGVPKQSVCQTRYSYLSSDGTPKEDFEEITYDIEFHRTSLPAFEFTNSAFGFPEPDWYRPPPPYWLYVSIIAIILVILGAILFRIGQKMMRKH